MRSDHLNSDAVTYVATIEAQLEGAAAIAANLESAESPLALAVSLFEHGPDRAEVSAYYAEKPSRELLIQLIERTVGNEDLGGFRIELLPPKNWVAEAESLRGPVRAGRFLVYGAHDRGKVPAGRFTLEIDAGLAFGTAYHPTTRGCLLALDRLLKRGGAYRFIDIGTGTGILAIATARGLNNTRGTASDMDPIAVAVASENARKNGVQSRVRVVHAEGFAHPALRRATFDLLFANILLCPLLELAPVFARALRPGGICVLSGLLEPQARQVQARVCALGFTLDSRILLDGWTTLLLRRRGAVQRIDYDEGRPYKAVPCFKASKRSARLAPCRSG